MSISTYPGGFRDGVLLQEIPTYDTTGGRNHWVDSGVGLAGNKGTFLSPVATINQAVSLSAGGRRDTIYVKAGYSQVVADGTDLVIDIADTHVIGLGRGTSRPALNFTDASSTITISAANCSIQNMVADANVSDVLSAFTITSTDAIVSDFVLTEAAAGKNWLSIFDTGTSDNAADGATFSRVHIHSIDAQFEAFVNVDEDIDLLTVEDSYVSLAVNSALPSIAVVAAGKDTTKIQIHRNYMTRLVNAAAIQIITWADTTTTNTGLISFNESRCLDIAGELLATAGTNVHFTNNRSTSVIDKSAYLGLPAVDA